MREVSFLDTDRVYGCSTNASLRIHRIEHQGFREYSLSFRELVQKLGDDAQDEYWISVLRKLGGYRFEASAAPLSFSDPAIGAQAACEFLREHLVDCAAIYPNVAVSATAMIDRLSILALDDEAPMRSICSALAATGPDCALLLKSSRLVTKVRQLLDVLSPTGSLDVVTPPQPHGGRC